MRKLIFSAIIIATATLFACSKEESIEIPTALSNSTWCSTINPDTFEQTSVEFIDSKNAVLTVVKRGYGTDELMHKVEYSYTYNAPNISLMPKDFISSKITGQMIKLDDDYIYLHLISNVGDLDIKLTQMPSKDQTIWQ